MQNFPIISHVDILFCIFENRKLMSQFSVSQLEHLKKCIDVVLSDKVVECSDYECIED